MMAKLEGLRVPQLPPRLAAMTGQVAKAPGSTSEWRPKMDSLVASSTKANGHSAPVCRLAVSFDQRFFVSGSHDGTCRVWLLEQLETSAGVLESSAMYSLLENEHNSSRVTDIALVEQSHSIATGASDGSVRVWRVDLTKNNPLQASDSRPMLLSSPNSK
jgi:phosphoinositide-3-kinase regulatory subunit 4